MSAHFTRLILRLAIFAFSATASFSQTAVPAGITYQGRLTNTDGSASADGIGYEIEVRLWSAPTGGAMLWAARYSGVPVKTGAFNLILGSTTGAAIAGAMTTDLQQVFTTVAAVYLGLTVGKGSSGAAIASPSEIVPRQQLLAVPFAMSAANAANGVPRGAIIMWSGAQTQIPNGWALCDGNGGTPDLRDRFVVAAGRAYSLGSTGGATNHSHTAQSHNHTISRGPWASTITQGSSSDSQGMIAITTPNYQTFGANGWGLTVDLPTRDATVQVSQVVGTDGSLPPYYGLAFIMKL